MSQTSRITFQEPLEDKNEDVYYTKSTREIQHGEGRRVLKRSWWTFLNVLFWFIFCQVLSEKLQTKLSFKSVRMCICLAVDSQDNLHVLFSSFLLPLQILWAFSKHWIINGAGKSHSTIALIAGLVLTFLLSRAWEISLLTSFIMNQKKGSICLACTDSTFTQSRPYQYKMLHSLKITAQHRPLPSAACKWHHPEDI